MQMEFVVGSPQKHFCLKYFEGLDLIDRAKGVDLINMVKSNCGARHVDIPSCT